MYDSGNTNQVCEQGTSAAACRNLWQAVLLREWELVFGGPGARGAKTQPDHNWFGTRGFFDVCALAGMDGVAVLDRYQAKRAGGRI